MERLPRCQHGRATLDERDLKVWGRTANGNFGWPRGAVDDPGGGGWPSVPPPLFEQLAEAGLMVMRWGRTARLS